MSSYDFIIDNIRFSYSSSSTYQTCPYSFKLSYIDAMPRTNNFYAEYGTLIHETMEKYFRDELEMFELSDYFKDNFDTSVVTPPPPVPEGMKEKYRLQGQAFFDYFYFDKNEYDVLLVEGKFELDLDGIKFVTKPDLVLHNKKSNENILVDYKTSDPFKIDKRNGKEKIDMAKMESYYKQMYLYTYALRTQMGINIDKITLWFPRPNRTHSISWDARKEKDTLDWVINIINQIKNEEEFPFNNSNSYFCSNLCGVREFCEYW